jgi:hypothetical protein
MTITINSFYAITLIYVFFCFISYILISKGEDEKMLRNIILIFINFICFIFYTSYLFFKIYNFVLKNFQINFI